MKRKIINSRRLVYHKRRKSSKRSTIHLWKRSDIVRKTINNRKYKIWRQHIEEPLSCWYCSPHEGCNYSRDHIPYKSWKFKYKKENNGCINQKNKEIYK